MPHSSVGRVALGWVGRVAMLLGGATVAVRFGLPKPSPSAAIDNGIEGRGKPGIPASRGARAEGHETEDMSGGLMGRLVIGLGVVMASLIAVVFGFRALVQRADDAARPPLTAEQVTRVVPPAPNLQSDPVGDLARLRESEDRLLNNYAWIDPEHTRGRIPIDRAMALIVGHPVDTAP